MAYWSCARLEQNRVELGLHFLELAGFTTYCPRVRVERGNGVNGASSALLFAPYTFLQIELQWRAADRSPGVVGLIMDGEHPGRVPDRVIAELRARERDGLVVLPQPPALRRGDRVRIIKGPFRDHLAIYQDMKPRERIEVLLALFGSERRVELGRGDIRRLNGLA